MIWPFLTLSKRAGYGDLGVLVRARLGLTAVQFADPTTRVPLHHMAQLLSAALERGGQRDIGLQAARYVDSVHLGVMEQVTRSRTSLRAALEAGIRYVPLLGDGVHYSFSVDGELATSCLWFDPGLRLHEAAVEFVLAIGLLWSRRMTGIEQLAPLAVHFAHPRPADTRRHEKLFRCALHFDAPVNKVVMSARFLDRALDGAEPVLAELLQQRAEGLLQTLPRAHDTTAQVREILSGQRELRRVTAVHVARRMGLGARTLARRLADEQTSYRDVLDDVRKRAALEALARGDRAIGDIAQALGFASPQGFHRAFRRWTGTSAAAYRKDPAVLTPAADSRTRSSSRPDPRRTSRAPGPGSRAAARGSRHRASRARRR
jgi:AraC-like DNA-binding protein